MPDLRKLLFIALATLALGFTFSTSQVAFAQVSPDLIISQVYGGGGNAGSTYTHDFIELYNRGTSPVVVTGYAVQYNSAAGAGTWQTTPLSGTIQPGRFYLVQEAQGAGGTTPLPTPNAIGTIPMGATSGKVALTNTTTALSGSCPSVPTIVDLVGFGTTATCFEGAAPAPAPSNTTAIIRNGSGTIDTGSNSTDFTATTPTPRNALVGTQLLISEFRTFGPTGTCDEFIEIYNPSGSPFTVQSAATGSLGFGVAQSNGNVLFTIPNGTVIPARGHYLAVNNGGACTGSYSGGAYPAGTPAATATGDNTLNEDIPTNAGIAIFNTSLQAGFNMTNRLDAVGPTTAPALYVEGTGYPLFSAALSGNPGVNYSIFRDARSGAPVDTDNNETDFQTASINGTNLCGSTINFRCQRLGAPGPENLSSPVQRNAEIKALLVDTQCASIAVNPTLRSACRFERRTDAGSGYGSSPTSTGTLSIRRRFTNNTGVSITRLRFRIVDITTFPALLGTADLRAISSTQVTATCQSEGGTPHLCSDNPTPTTIIEGTTLETDASGQSNGGAFNSTLSLATPLAAGASVNVQFLLGVEQNGTFRFFINIEALPAPTGAVPALTNSATKSQTIGKARAVKDGN